MRLRHRVCFSALVACVAFAGLSASSANAVTPGPNFAIEAEAFPTNITPFPPPGAEQYVSIHASNVGAADTNGELLTIKDTLPTGLTVLQASGVALIHAEEHEFSCVHTNVTVSCTYEGTLPGHAAGVMFVRIGVAAEPTLPEATYQNTASVSGGGAVPASSTGGLTVSVSEPQFAFDGPFSARALGSDGAIDTQAGGHPSSLTAGFVVNNVFKPTEPASQNPVNEVKDASIQLPLGLVGDPQAAPSCPEPLLIPPADGALCPRASVVGSITYYSGNDKWAISGKPSLSTLYNLTPQRGHAAEFGFTVLGQLAILYADLVHTAAGYVVRITSSNIVPNAHLIGINATVFGDPAVVDGGGTPERPFFTNPSDCSSGPEMTVANLDSWQNPAPMPRNSDGSPDIAATNFSESPWQRAAAESPPVTGCERLQFNPTLTVEPDTAQSGSPSGLNLDLNVPQNEAIEGLATPPLKETKVALPQGMVVNPSQANGLQACSDAQFEAEATEVATCPEASQIGTVTVHTPILANTLEGQVFLGSPLCSPCSNADAQSGRLARIFIQVHSAQYGVTLKIPGSVALNPSTGQLTATFKDTPQQPFDELKLQLKGGQRAPLVTPTSCGTYSSSVDLTPWSAPYTPDALSSPSFNVSEGCGARGFAPSFTGGTISSRAGEFSPFTLTLARGDGEQYLDALESTLPPGLLAKLADVPLCGNAEASAGNCPAGSRIGSVTARVGSGSDPYYVTGSIYLAGPYNGGPFGEVVEVPAVAGPFNLGTVVVRGSIRVNPTTAQGTVVSDPFPSILDGIPLQDRTVNVTLDRPGFTFNATSCNQMALTGKVLSTQGTVAAVSSPYETADCASLSFKPVFSAATAAHSSKAAGASLDVRVTSKGGPQTGGREANIAAVKVDLPRQLPSRLTTLQKACIAKVFEANPAACPKESDVGTAAARTPLLANPLSGPAYLVSHGGAAFPDLEVILQGEGVVLVLDGKTDIKKGITSSSFATVPDAPISSFELKLPTGKFSVLSPFLPASANFSFCGQKLSMPTRITAQSGAVIKQNTQIGIAGCPKARKAVRAAAKHARGGTQSRRKKANK